MITKSVRRIIGGTVLTVGGIGLVSLPLVAVRSHLSVTTPALILMVPVILGVAVGGFGVGLAGIGTAFLAYDFFFLPPYDTLTVGTARNWIALVVYALVMLLVAQIVSMLQHTRAMAQHHEQATSRLHALSELLIGDKPAVEFLHQVAATIEQTFRPRWVAIVLPEGDQLSVAATAGATLSEVERQQLSSSGGRVQSLGSAASTEGTVQISLTSAGGPVGLLTMAGVVLDEDDRSLLRTYANHVALALDRSRLREQDLRNEVLEQTNRWRDALMGAVSHDLRTPLASMKAAVSTLRRPDLTLAPADVSELLAMIETQSDVLARLVTDLLDMSRIQAGVLELRNEVGPISDVVAEAIASLGHSGDSDRVQVRIPPELPMVDVDQILMVQAVVNVLENALRHSPPGWPVEIDAAVATSPGDLEEVVELTVLDHGPGIPLAERERVFEMFNRAGGGGRAGLGLTIAKAFVDAHGQTIRAEEAPGGGARFVLTMPRATVPGDA